MTDNDLRKRIAGQRERLIFSDCLFLCSQRVGRLNVGLLTAGGCNEVDFPRNRRELSFGIFLIAIDDGLAEKFTNKPDNISMKRVRRYTTIQLDINHTVFCHRSPPRRSFFICAPNICAYRWHRQSK